MQRICRFCVVAMLAAAGAGDRASAAEPEPQAPPVDHIRGLVVPLQRARLSSRLVATIESIGPEDGEPFKAGDILVQFDCGAYEAEREKARAEAAAAEASLAVKRELANGGNASKLQAVLAESELRKARAAVDTADRQVADCQIKAPYAGRVIARLANAHETVGLHDPLIEIVADQALELRVFIPSRALRTVGTGSRLELMVDETGERLAARVVALGAQVENVSQLIEIRARFTGDTARLIPGMSGNVHVLGPAPAGTP